MPVQELFSEYYRWTVSSGGTDAPAANTAQTFTVTSAAGAPPAATGVSQFRIVDAADLLAPPEIMTVTNIAGTTWSVKRGAEGGVPWAHASNWTAVPVLTAQALNSIGGGVSFPLTSTASTATTNQYKTNVTGDTVWRFAISAAGTLGWGDGSSNDATSATPQFSIGPVNESMWGTVLRSNQTFVALQGIAAEAWSSVANALWVYAQGDSDFRMVMDATGSMTWFADEGSGNIYWTPDVCLTHLAGAHGTQGLVLASTNPNNTTGWPALVPLTMKGAPSQSGDLLDFDDSANHVLSKVLANGSFVVNTPPSYASYSPLKVGLNTFAGGNGLWFGPDNQDCGVVDFSGNGTALQVRTASNFLSIQNSPSAWSFYGGGYWLQVAAGAPTFPAVSAATVPMTVKAAASQTADLQDWTDSNNNVLAKVGPAGNFSVGGWSLLRGASDMDATAMSASQVFNMTTGTSTGHLYWVGPNSPTATWMPNSDGQITVPGIYVWRFRFWTQTAPSVAGTKLGVIINGINLAHGRVWQVDDLTFSAAWRPGLEVMQTYQVGDSTPYPIPYVAYNFSVTDATGILKYDMACWRLAY